MIQITVKPLLQSKYFCQEGVDILNKAFADANVEYNIKKPIDILFVLKYVGLGNSLIGLSGVVDRDVTKATQVVEQYNKWLYKTLLDAVLDDVPRIDLQYGEVYNKQKHKAKEFWLNKMENSPEAWPTQLYTWEAIAYLLSLIPINVAAAHATQRMVAAGFEFEKLKNKFIELVESA